MNTVDPITATYVHDEADWTITVSGLGKELTDRAPGIIAARDRADQLVEKVAPERNGRTVVHLLNGSAFEFTAAYIEARLTRSAANAGATTNAADEQVPDESEQAEAAARRAAARTKTVLKAPKRTRPQDRATPGKQRSAQPTGARKGSTSRGTSAGGQEEATAVATAGSPG